ncbi:MAG: phosphomannomutase [Thermodesulfobacteriota bacterium]
MDTLDCFKSYDIRGQVPRQLDAALAWRIGRAFAAELRPETVVLGYDIRETSRDLAGAAASGLAAGGADVLDIGLCGTEEVYFATAHFRAGGGIMVTASHNPRDHNGMKLVGPGSAPISGDTGLGEIKARVAAENWGDAPPRAGSTRPLAHRRVYIERLLGTVDLRGLAPLRLVANPGNGCAGPLIDALEPHLPFSWIKVHHEPDGSFPNGVPNPLLPERRQATADAVRAHKADMGLAWDGDFDRCFFYDEQGRFIEGYYLVGLLARLMLRKHPGQVVLHDPRLVWNTRAVVLESGGAPIMTKTGHAFIKERMRRENAVYGGEMSAHHYFRDFYFCDSGMIPWLLVAELVSATGRPLSTFVDAMIRDYPSSGEINMQLDDPAAALALLREHYGERAASVDEVDGLSMDMGDWRFNIRSSNTEPLVRLNVESRGDPELMRAKTREIRNLVRGGN